MIQSRDETNHGKADDMLKKKKLAEIVRNTQHATDELKRIQDGGIRDRARLSGIRSELLNASLLLTEHLEDDMDIATADVEQFGPGYET